LFRHCRAVSDQDTLDHHGRDWERYKIFQIKSRSLIERAGPDPPRSPLTPIFPDV
jgi:hypothetical protein